MSPTRRALLGAAVLAPFAAQAQSTLERNARILVGFPAGGTVDVTARLVAERLRGLYAPQVLVEQRVGAAGRLALEALRAAEPDGLTLCLSPASMLAIFPHLYARTLRYDALADFVPVSPVVLYPFGLAVGPGAPGVTDLAGLLRSARAGGVTYASPAAGSVPHFTGVMLARAAGVELTHVPYRGAAPAIADALGGQIAATLNVLGDLVAHHQAGRLRVIAVTAPARVPSLPEVPTFAELGHPDLTADEWFGMFLPARAPAAIVAALNSALAAAVAVPEVQERLAGLGFTTTHSAPEAFAARIRAEHAKWGPIVAASGFRPDE